MLDFLLAFEKKKLFEQFWQFPLSALTLEIICARIQIFLAYLESIFCMLSLISRNEWIRKKDCSNGYRSKDQVTSGWTRGQNVRWNVFCIGHISRLPQRKDLENIFPRFRHSTDQWQRLWCQWENINSIRSVFMCSPWLSYEAVKMSSTVNVHSAPIKYRLIEVYNFFLSCSPKNLNPIAIFLWWIQY